MTTRAVVSIGFQQTQTSDGVCPASAFKGAVRRRTFVPSLLVAIFGAIPHMQAAVAGPVVFINEFHYNDGNSGLETNADDFVEIAGRAGTDLAAYRVVNYDPAGQLSGSVALSGVIPDQNNGFGTIDFPFFNPASAPGAPRAFALVHGSAVIQFISVDGVVTAVNGPTGSFAAGLTSTDIGLFERSTTPNTHSLQLQGATGDDYTDFTWTGPIDATRDAVNANQTFQALVDTVAALVVTKTADTSDDVCDADCSLREAITLASRDPGAESISFNIPTNDSGYDLGNDRYTIGLIRGLPALEGTSITGLGSARLTVTRGSTNNFRVLETRGGVPITLSGMTVSNGALADRFFSGAGLRNTTTLLLIDIAIRDNHASSASFGGGIENNGLLTLVSSTISDNSAIGDCGNGCPFFSAAGGINNTATLIMTDSVVSGNSLGTAGGGIHNSGTTTLTNVLL